MIRVERGAVSGGLTTKVDESLDWLHAPHTADPIVRWRVDELAAQRGRDGPVDVQPRLDARCEKERDAGLCADLFGVAVGLRGFVAHGRQVPPAALLESPHVALSRQVRPGQHGATRAPDVPMQPVAPMGAQAAGRGWPVADVYSLAERQ